MNMDTFTLDEAMDLVSADVDRADTPTPSAGWRGGRHCESLIRYTNTIRALTREAIDVCQKDVVEIGTDFGLGAFALSYGIRRHTSRSVITFDIRESTVEDTRERAKKLGATNIVFVHGTSEDVHAWGDCFSFAYIDGGHTFDHCFTDLNNVAPRMHKYGLILCHDVHYRFDKDGVELPANNGVREAIVEFVKQNPSWIATRVCGFGLLGRQLH